MGVVKNLMVRIVADASGIVSGMKRARSATSQATGSIKESVSGMRKSVKGSFGEARMSVREYSEYVAKTKENHTIAAQNVERLTDKIGQMKNVYGSIKNATSGLDLSTPLKKQIADTEKQLDKTNEKIYRTRVQIESIGSARTAAKSARLDVLRRQLEALIAESDSTASHLRTLDTVAKNVGVNNMGHASDAGLKKMQGEIASLERELRMAQAQADKTGQRLRAMGIAPTLKYALRSIGTAAAQTVGGGVRKLASGLKSLGGSAVRGIASLPGKLRNIGKSASAGTGGLNRMVRSIRNIGAVSLGLRIAQGMFGRLRSIISQYISQNEALNASVNNLKNQMGQAMAPAINIVIAALQKLMPVVTAVANAINSIFVAIFGNVTSTAAAVTASAEAADGAAESLETYGFDQITKVSDNSGGGGSTTTATDTQTQEQSALVQKLTGWIQQLKDAFVAGDWDGLGKIVGDGINKAVGAIDAVDVGAKAGRFANNLITTLHSALSTINFSGIGAKAGQMLTSAMEQVNWSKAGDTIGKAMTAIPSIIVGFIQNTNWKNVAENLSELLVGALSSVGEWIRSVNWLDIGKCIWEFVSNINYEEIAKSLFSLFGSALGAGVSILWGFISGAVDSIKQYFSEKIEECGGNVAEGLLKGILDGLVGIGTWIKDNIFTPFIEGFKSTFGIHSPSTVMEEQGGFLASGVLNGFSSGWGNLTTFLSEGLGTLESKIDEAWTKCRDTTKQKWSEISGTVSSKATDLKNKAAEKIQGMKKVASEIWSNMKSDAVSGAANITDGAVTGFTKMKRGIADVFSALWNVVKGWINKLIGGVESMANLVIRGINKMIGSFNKIASVGEAVGLNLKISEIATVSLPRLATGGIADGPTAAIIGEAGKEAVLPLEGSNSVGWMTQLAQKIVDLSRNGGSGPVSLTIPIYLGGRKVTEYVIKDINQITKSTGVCPVKV